MGVFWKGALRIRQSLKYSTFFGRGTANTPHYSDGHEQRRFLTDFEMEKWADKMIEHKLREGLKGAPGCFSELVHWWDSNVFQSTLNVNGIRLLVRVGLDAEQTSTKVGRSTKGSIATLWECVKDTMRGSDFLAFLVMEMIEREQLEEATIFAKLLSINGTSFVRPLQLLKWRTVIDDDTLAEKFRQNLENEDENWAQNQLCLAQRVVEQLSAVIQECYFDVQEAQAKGPGTKRNRTKEQPETEPDGKKQSFDSLLIASSRYQSLLMIWMPNRMIRYWYDSNAKVGAFKPRKPFNSSKRMHRVDAKQMAKLGNTLVDVWAAIAIKNANVGSWERLMAYVRYNSLPLDPRLTERWDRQRLD